MSSEKIDCSKILRMSGKVSCLFLVNRGHIFRSFPPTFSWVMALSWPLYMVTVIWSSHQQFMPTGCLLLLAPQKQKITISLRHGFILYLDFYIKIKSSNQTSMSIYNFISFFLAGLFLISPCQLVTNITFDMLSVIWFNSPNWQYIL